MMEFLEFMFQSFAHWLGVVIVVSLIAEGIGSFMPWNNKCKCDCAACRRAHPKKEIE